MNFKVNKVPPKLAICPLEVLSGDLTPCPSPKERGGEHEK